MQAPNRTAEPAKKKPGRPRKLVRAGIRASLGLKVTADVKEKMERAADASGRTQSQEAEYRLVRSFDQQDLLPDLIELRFGKLGIMALGMLAIMEKAGRRAVLEVTGDFEACQGDRWMVDPSGFDAAVQAANAVLEKARPPGAVQRHQAFKDYIIKLLTRETTP